jgi:uncharacterized LabA/DUF88 family protein
VEVMAFDSSTADELKAEADTFIDLGERLQTFLL